MKPITLQTILSSMIGWILDFQNDNNRLPQSLDDLIKNKSDKRDYNPERVIKRNQNDGYSFEYSLSGDSDFEIKIGKDEQSAIYKSTVKTVYYYRNNAEVMQSKLSD